MSLKIVTWNVNSIKMRLNHLCELISEHDPDIICLQELKCETDKFPYEELSYLPYNFYVYGQKSYNGVGILSKIPADEIKTEFEGNPLPEHARFIEGSFATSIGYIRVISLYAPNGAEIGSDKFKTKLTFYDAFNDYVQSLTSFEEKLFIGSDYNIAPFDIDVYDTVKLKDALCCTMIEKEKIRTLLNSGFVDNYRILHPNKNEFTWWDYRAGSFEQNKGMRIDSIISTSNALQNLSECIIDYKTREKLKASDHAPVIAIYKN